MGKIEKEEHSKDDIKDLIEKYTEFLTQIKKVMIRKKTFSE